MGRRRSKADEGLTYKASGVDIAAGDRLVDSIGPALRRTFDPRVLSRHGAFAGLMRLDFRERLLRRRYREPVLAAGTDGVGSKLLLGLEWGRLGDLGIDLVAMNANDVLTVGAEPLFFLDYVACHRLVPEQIARLVEGMAEGCRRAGCALLGGETAEMPGLYANRHFDLAGFCVGVVEQRRIIDGSGVEPGDAVIGLGSDGLHANGFSLVCRVLKRVPGRSGALPVDLGEPLADAVMRPTRIYVKPILKLLARYRRKRVVRAMAHITGGGLPGNLPRVVPPGCTAQVARGSWPVPPVFRLIRELGVAEAEMAGVFNMGIGFVLIVRPAFASSIMHQLERLGERAYRIGTVRRGSRGFAWR